PRSRSCGDERRVGAAGDHGEVDVAGERRPLHLRGRSRREQASGERGRRARLQGERAAGPGDEGPRQDAARGAKDRQASRSPQGHRPSRRGTEDRTLLRGGRLMPLKKFKPTSAGMRFRQSPDFSGLSKKRPEKSLVQAKRRQAGRNVQGKVTTRHRGGGEKRLYRVIDFKRDKDGVPARVA